jgi:hypothetical protein
MAKIFFLFTVTFFLLRIGFPPPFFQGQGLEGVVYQVTGNQMPSPDIKPSKPRGFQTVVYVYPLTSLDQVKRKDLSSFYYAIQTTLIRKIETDSNGYFKVKLPPGQYSIFTKKDTLFYANWFDGNNHIAPVTVQRGKITKIEVRMDADATY